MRLARLYPVPRIDTPTRQAKAGERTPAEVDMHVGARVRMRRRFLGLTQQALAESLGLTFQQVQKYERGANRVSASKLYEIARALHVPVPYFFEGLADTGSGADDSARDTELSIREFLMTPEGQELAQLYPRIGPSRLRRQVLELVRAIAGDERDGG
jgi:transcriptional regulator with XRE-family HTH domain